MGIGEKWKFLSNKWKYAIGIGIIVCMVALVYCGNVYAKNKLQKQINASDLTEKRDLMTEVVKINQKVPLFFDEKDSNFLAETVTEEQINSLEKELNQVTQSNQSKVSESGGADYDQEVAKAQKGWQRIKKTYETKKSNQCSL